MQEKGAYFTQRVSTEEALTMIALEDGADKEGGETSMIGDQGVKNDYDGVAEAIGRALAAFTGNAHEPSPGGIDAITMTKDGFITGVIRLQRLRDRVEGLAAAHRMYQDEVS